jgi:thioredoxin-like negative regulator of GroEL
LNYNRHCKRFAPTYESVAKTLHGVPERNIKVAKVDGSQEMALASRFSVRGFPSFYLVDGWDVYEFKDARTREKLINFATKAPNENEVCVS